MVKKKKKEKGDMKGFLKRRIKFKLPIKFKKSKRLTIKLADL